MTNNASPYILPTTIHATISLVTYNLIFNHLPTLPKKYLVGHVKVGQEVPRLDHSAHLLPLLQGGVNTCTF